ncbi:hypothetical protein CA85_06120 [Allorhodopirellula solitaria]|uniref:DUF58 domain-containing protein n=1 Tax=Allorhodopirellula solitaria TaxID=2527987 RepID=A0A5C5YKE4_9BACT|nr:hypothetical protein CA85_06120 [Allorhodopirellula solitaria]
MLLVLGMIAGAGLWMIAAMAVAMVVALGAYVSSQWSLTVTAHREELPESGRDIEVLVGSRVPICVAVTNTGRLPVAWVLAEDLLPRAATVEVKEHEDLVSRTRVMPLTVEGPRLAVLALLPGQTKHLRYSVHCRRRGYYQIGPTVLETGDPAGMFRRYRLGTPPLFITVLPRIELISNYDIGSRRPMGEIRIRANVMPDPTRIRGIRQWQIGDPMRSVHWAATARTGTLHTKIYEPSSVIGATIVIDLHVATNPDRHEPLRTDLSVTAAVSIAAALLEAGEPFGLATNGRDAADRVRSEGFRGDHRIGDFFPMRNSVGSATAMRRKSDRLRPVLIDVDRGPQHLKEITRTLARIERTDGLTLSEFLIDTEPRLSSETTLLVIMQEAPPETVASLVGLSRRGWAVAVVLNADSIDEYTRLAAPLLAEKIHVSHLLDRDSVRDVCREQVVR